jgi:hypothetical protein
MEYNDLIVQNLPSGTTTQNLKIKITISAPRMMQHSKLNPNNVQAFMQVRTFRQRHALDHLKPNLTEF